MPSATTRIAPARLSLRGMLILVAAVASAISSMTYASDWWQIGVTTLALFVFAAAAIVALVDRGAPQAFALGMVVVMTIYAGLIAYSSLQTAREFNPEFSGQGRMPTTRFLDSIYDRIAERRYYDWQTGVELPNFDPAKFPQVQLPARRVETPPQRQFMQIGHAWFTLLLAYLGGQFARAVHIRRTSLGRHIK